MAVPSAGGRSQEIKGGSPPFGINDPFAEMIDDLFPESDLEAAAKNEGA